MKFCDDGVYRESRWFSRWSQPLSYTNFSISTEFGFEQVNRKQFWLMEMKKNKQIYISSHRNRIVAAFFLENNSSKDLKNSKYEKLQPTINNIRF